MKRIECIVSENRYHDLENALREYGIPGLTVTNVKGFGNQQTRPEPFILLPKVKLEIYCGEDMVEDIIGMIMSVCKTDKHGSGKIAVYEILDLVRVRTGERGAVAV